MDYYFTKTIETSFSEAVEKVTEELRKNGFGIITEIDVKSTFKKKLDVDFYEYRILGACNPKFAYEALTREDKIGVMLPCNVIVQERRPGEVEVSAVNPLTSMGALDNRDLARIAVEVHDILKRVIENL